MARRGKFGRSGTTQNLTMLVYQIMKEQMETELDNILDAYKANMTAGTYVSQFNGQNVDAGFVISYYESMLAGFPSGSTEYQTILSKLESFRENSRTDIQNLVISSMRDGSKIDFGLLGSQFANKGISDVELSDVRGWADQEVADLIADGNNVQADKLRSAVFVAGFNIENDGKSAAVDREELGYSGYAKWLKKQMDAALDSGLTTSSDAYLAIEKAYSQAVKSAKVEGQNNAVEGFEKAIDNSLSGVNKAAKAIIDQYVKNGDGIFTDTINTVLGSLSSSDAAYPWYAVLRTFATEKSGKIPGGYDALMSAAGPEFAGLFGASVAQSNTQLNNLLSGGFGAAGTANSKALRGNVLVYLSQGEAFVKQSGIQFNVGGGSTVLERFERDLKSSGAVFQTDDSGVRTFIGGHPDAILGSIDTLSEGMKGIDGAEEYSWLSDVAKKRVSTELLDPIFKDFDGNDDGYVDLAEFQTGFTNAELNLRDYNDALGRMNLIMDQQYSPSSTLRPSAYVGALIDSGWSTAALAAGSIMVVEPTGAVKVSDWGDRNPAGIGPEIFPTTITVNGKESTAFVQPISITQGDQGAEADLAYFGGMTVRVYRTPGNLGSQDNLGQTDATVVITGGFDDGATGTSNRSYQLTFDEFEQYARHNGIEIDSIGIQDPGENGVSIKITSGVPGSSGAWKNMFNPNSTDSIFRAKVTDPTSDRFNQPIVPTASSSGADSYKFYGILGSQNLVNARLQSAFTDRIGIINEASRIATNKGKSTFDLEDIQQAGIKLVLGDTSGILSQETVRNLVLQNPTVAANIARNFSDIKPAAQKDTNIGPYGTGVYGAFNTSAPASSVGPSPYLQNLSDTSVSPFVTNAFRNKPEMAKNPVKPVAQAPQIKPISGGGGIRGGVSTVKPIQTAAVKPLVVKPTAAGVAGTAGATGGLRVGGQGGRGYGGATKMIER
jgi:hypothetical protein